MGKDIDLKSLALDVAELFGVDLEIEEGRFTDPERGPATVKLTMALSGIRSDLGWRGVCYARDLEEAAKQAILAVTAQHVPDEDE